MSNPEDTEPDVHVPEGEYPPPPEGVADAPDRDDERTVSDLMVERLRAWGVTRVFGYPGDGINGFMGALRRAAANRRSFRRGTRRTPPSWPSGTPSTPAASGSCLATQGPGAVHLLNGLYDAKLDGVPVVAIVGEQHRAARRPIQQEVELRDALEGTSPPVRPRRHAPRAGPDAAGPGVSDGARHPLPAAW